MLLFYNVCFVLNWEIAAKTAARGKSFRAPAGNTGAVFDANYLKHLWQHNMISSVFKSVATVVKCMHVQLHTYIDKGALSAGLNWRRKQKVWLVAEMQLVERIRWWSRLSDRSQIFPHSFSPSLLVCSPTGTLTTFSTLVLLWNCMKIEKYHNVIM